MKQKGAHLEPTKEMYTRMKEHLYSKQPILGEDSPFSELLQNMVNTILEGEMESFIDSERELGHKNKRNGSGLKKVRTGVGNIWVSTPRDRNADFEPMLIEKRERELSTGLDEQIIALYAQGNSVEDVRRLLVKMLGVEISAGKISQITDKVLPVHHFPSSNIILFLTDLNRHPSTIMAHSFEVYLTFQDHSLILKSKRSVPSKPMLLRYKFILPTQFNIEP